MIYRCKRNSIHEVNSILAEHLKAAHAPFFEWLQRP